MYLHKDRDINFQQTLEHNLHKCARASPATSRRRSISSTILSKISTYLRLPSTHARGASRPNTVRLHLLPTAAVMCPALTPSVPAAKKEEAVRALESLVFERDDEALKPPFQEILAPLGRASVAAERAFHSLNMILG